jgi:hypothetical protein
MGSKSVKSPMPQMLMVQGLWTQGDGPRYLIEHLERLDEGSQY